MKTCSETETREVVGLALTVAVSLIDHLLKLLIGHPLAKDASRPSFGQTHPSSPDVPCWSSSHGETINLSLPLLTASIEVALDPNAILLQRNLESLLFRQVRGLRVLDLLRVRNVLVKRSELLLICNLLARLHETLLNAACKDIIWFDSSSLDAWMCGQRQTS